MNRTTPLFLLGMIALAAWGGWEHIERNKVEARLAALEAAQPAPGARRRVVLPVKDKPEGFAINPETHENPETGKTGKDADKAPAQNAMAEGMMKMMQDPKMRDAMKAQARMGVTMVYRDLFDLLSLEEPKRSQFEALINEKATIGMELGFELMAGGKTPEERDKLMKEITAKTKEAEQKIRDLLTPEEYGKLERYEKSTPERMQLDSLRGMLSSTTAPLDEATETRLMDVMYQEREKAAFVSEFADQQNTDLTRFTPENLARFATDSTAVNEKIAERASEILSPGQMEVFRKSQEQQAAMVKMHIEMAAKIFGGGE